MSDSASNMSLGKRRMTSAVVVKQRHWFNSKPKVYGQRDG